MLDDGSEPEQDLKEFARLREPFRKFYTNYTAFRGFVQGSQLDSKLTNANSTPNVLEPVDRKLFSELSDLAEFPSPEAFESVESGSFIGYAKKAEGLAIIYGCADLGPDFMPRQVERALTAIIAYIPLVSNWYYSHVSYDEIMGAARATNCERDVGQLPLKFAVALDKAYKATRALGIKDAKRVLGQAELR